MKSLTSQILIDVPLGCVQQQLSWKGCECKKHFRDIVICDEKLQESYLDLGICMTYNSSYSDEQESDAISFGGCPYVHSNIVNHRYNYSSTTKHI